MTFQGRAPLLCSLLPKGIVAFTASGAALVILAEAFGGMERSCSRYSRRRSSPLLSVYEGQRCIGFVSSRGAGSGQRQARRTMSGVPHRQVDAIQRILAGAGSDFTTIRSRGGKDEYTPPP